uniref:Secreted protein n=1 Tax=Fagus sylvatica TaxID=28930 RepID=A0A2N9EDA8_FAGSY
MISSIISFLSLFGAGVPWALGRALAVVDAWHCPQIDEGAPVSDPTPPTKLYSSCKFQSSAPSLYGRHRTLRFDYIGFPVSPWLRGLAKICLKFTPNGEPEKAEGHENSNVHPLTGLPVNFIIGVPRRGVKASESSVPGMDGSVLKPIKPPEGHITQRVGLPIIRSMIAGSFARSILERRILAGRECCPLNSRREVAMGDWFATGSRPDSDLFSPVYAQGIFFPSSSLSCFVWNFFSGPCGLPLIVIVWDNDESFHTNQSGFSTSAFSTSVGHL